MERAAAKKIESKVLVPKEYESREAYGQALTHTLTEAGIDLVVLAGFFSDPSGEFCKSILRTDDQYPSIIDSISLRSRILWSESS